MAGTAFAAEALEETDERIDIVGIGFVARVQITARENTVAVGTAAAGAVALAAETLRHYARS